MCGINFITTTTHPVEPSIKMMMEATAHRGPDYSAYSLINKHTGIAHNRLSIIDPSPNSNQPFTVNNRYFLSFNGEIYNHKELRKELQSKNAEITFQTNSDTEVLMHLLILEGKSSLSKLEGMYAFIFYDTQTNYLLAANDSFGIKPIYFHSSKESLIISSESKPIHNIIKSEINVNAIPQFLNFKYSEETTFFENINRLNSIHIIERIDNVTKLNKRPPHTQNAPSDLKSTFEKAIQLNCVSDSPIGISLSGGIDSIAILHQLHLLGKRAITCFYVICDDDTNELKAVKKLTKNLNYKLEVIDFKTDFDSNFSHYLNSIDQPIGDIAGFLTFLVSKRARELNIKTLLAGIGSDELFGGYNRHNAIYWHSILKLCPLKPLQILAPQHRLLNKLAQNMRWSKSDTWNNYIRLSLPFITLVNTAKIQNLKTALDHEFSHFIKFQLLPLTDQSSMINGVEVRVPFLSNNLLNYSKSKPSSYFFKKHAKWELAKLFNLEKRTKKGFGISLNPDLFKNNLISSIFDKLEDPNHLFYTFIDYKKTQDLIFEQKNQLHNHSLELWTLVIGAYWIDKQLQA